MRNIVWIVLAIVWFGAVAPVSAQDGIPCPGEPTNMPITYGDVVSSCQIEIGTDTDDFTFAGITGEVIAVNVSRGCVTLTAPGGSTADVCTDSTNRLDAVLAETGTFRITVRRAPGTSAFFYNVALERVIPASPSARPIQFGETIADQFNVNADLDMFSFTGGVSQTVVVVMDSPGLVARPCVEIIAPDNSRTVGCMAGLNNRVQATLTQAGTHVILARQLSDLAGPYSLELLCVSGSCSLPPGPPNGLTGTVSTYSTSLSWTAPASGGAVSSYVVEAGTTSGGTNVVAFDTLSTGTTFVAPGIPNGTYFVRVKARNAAGTSAASNEITITGGGGGCAPSPPGNLTASVSGFNVSFQWTGSSGSPTTYVLEAGTSAGASNLVTIDVGLATQFGAAAPAGTYFVRARARNACGLSAASNEVTVAVGQSCTTAPGAPATFTASLAGRVVSLAWSAATGQPSSYVLEAGTASGSSNLANQDVGNQLSAVGNVPPGTYFIRVRARNACGISAASVERIVAVP